MEQKLTPLSEQSPSSRVPGNPRASVRPSTPPRRHASPSSTTDLSSRVIAPFGLPTDPRQLRFYGKRLTQLDPTSPEYGVAIQRMKKLGYPDPHEAMPDVQGPRSRRIGDQDVLIDQLVRKAQKQLALNPEGNVRIVIPGGMLGGKSAFAARLAEKLRASGLPTEQFGTDVFYKSRAERYRDGLHNTMERFAPEFQETLSALPRGGNVRRPQFNELTGERTGVSEVETKGKVIVFEGAQTAIPSLLGMAHAVVQVSTTEPIRLERGGVRDACKQVLGILKKMPGVSKLTLDAIAAEDKINRTATVTPGLSREVSQSLQAILERDPVTRATASDIIGRVQKAETQLFEQRLRTDSADCLTPLARKMTERARGLRSSSGVRAVLGIEEPQTFVLRTDTPEGEAYRVGHSPNREPRSSIRVRSARKEENPLISGLSLEGTSKPIRRAPVFPFLEESASATPSPRVRSEGSVSSSTTPRRIGVFNPVLRRSRESVGSLVFSPSPSASPVAYSGSGSRLSGIGSPSPTPSFSSDGSTSSRSTLGSERGIKTFPRRPLSKIFSPPSPKLPVATLPVEEGKK